MRGVYDIEPIAHLLFKAREIETMKSHKILPMALLLVLSLPAHAASCPKDMKTIDAALAAGPSVSAEDLSKIKALRASGESKHKAGQHADSVADLHEAMRLLGIK